METMAVNSSQWQKELDRLVQADRVHRRVYTDPTLFEWEMERVFGRAWVFVAHESEVAKPGEFKTTVIGRQPVIVTRDPNGEIHVLYNRCMHRGALLCLEETGEAPHFRCAYHGWTYRNDGTLTGVPMRKGYPPDFGWDALRLMAVARVEAYRGFVFANLAPRGMSLLEYLGPAKVAIDNLVDRAPEGRLEMRWGSQKYEFRANWKMQIENVVDFYHPPFVHESTADRSGKQFKRQAGVSQAQIFDFSDEGLRFWEESTTHAFPQGHSYAQWPDQSPSLSEEFQVQYVRQLEARWGPERTQEILRTRIHNAAVYPNLVIQETSSHIRVIRPIAVDHTQVEVYPIRLVGAPDAVFHNVIRSINVTHSPASFIQTDDTEAFRRCQEGLQAVAPEWVIWARGMHRETDGLAKGERVGCGTDEVPQRGQFRYWKTLMGTTAEDPGRGEVN